MSRSELSVVAWDDCLTRNAEMVVTGIAINANSNLFCRSLRSQVHTHAWMHPHSLVNRSASRECRQVETTFALLSPSMHG